VCPPRDYGADVVVVGTVVVVDVAFGDG